MTLTGKTLEEDRQLVNKYAKLIDLVELRVHHLTEEEQLFARRFPAMIKMPCILTIRHDIDGGLFSGSEFSRTCLFSRALAFANQDKSKNFVPYSVILNKKTFFYNIRSKLPYGSYGFDVRVVEILHEIGILG